MAKLPLIALDTTVSDLYAQASTEHAKKRVAHVYCGVTSALDLTEDFPRNLKYVYQDGAFHDSSSDMNDDAHRSLAVKMLSLVPQRDAFISGASPVIFFHTDRSQGRKAHDSREASKTLNVLDPAQKPEGIFLRGPEEVTSIHERHRIDAVSSKVIVDGVANATDNLSNDGLASLVEIDKIWYLHSKEALARSGLPTPRSDVIELEEYEDGSKDCTPGHDLEMTSAFDCRRPSGYHEWIDQQVHTIVTELRKRRLPFVVKGNQSFGGAGT